MELLQLRYFRKVAKLEHMSRAAQELHIAQPALSKTIARLEHDIGVPLFDRQAGRIRLNSFGKIFLAKVEKALNLLDEGYKEVTELAGLEHGIIQIATPTLDRFSAPLSVFLSQYPHIQFRISQSTTEEMIDSIENGEIDLGFTAMTLKHPSLIQKTVLEEKLYVAVSNEHRLANRDKIHLCELADEPLIGYKEDNPFQVMNDKFFHEAGVLPKYVCRVDDPHSVLSLVSTGLGASLYGCVQDKEKSITFLPIESPDCKRSFQLVWKKDRYLSLAARKFCDFIAEYFAVNQDRIS